MLRAFQNWYDDHFDEIIRDFSTFLSFPSISTDPAYKKEVVNCSEWIVSYLKKLDLDTEIWETSGHPTIFAKNLRAGVHRPTLLIYHHYDVQPVTPLDLWKSDPFQPEIRDDSIYARGAVDNKGQCFYTLTAIKAFLELGEKYNFNLKLCIEGEEETGSHGLISILDKKKEDLLTDYILIIDTDMVDKDHPAITLGVRGIATLNIEWRVASADLHSGTFGGFILNPVRALASTLNKCWDEKGRVAIPNFYDNIRTFSEEELSAIDWDQNVQEMGKPFDIKAYSKENGFSYLESNWIRPTLEINGFESGYTGKGFKTIIPSKASVKLSCRLIADQDPEIISELVVDFFEEHKPEGIEMSVELGHGSTGFITTPHSKIAKIVSKAYEDVFAVPCKRVLCGGTLPIAPSIVEATGGELVLMGVGLPEDAIHSPNESFALNRFKMGFLSVVRIFQILSTEEG